LQRWRRQRWSRLVFEEKHIKNYNTISPSRHIKYADDNDLLGSADALIAMMPDFDKAFEDTGGEINKDKLKILLGPDATDEDVQKIADFLVQSKRMTKEQVESAIVRGSTITGAPIGGILVVKRMLENSNSSNP
jgi:hypothetical protein